MPARRVDWHPAALHMLRRYHWEQQAKIDAAVQRFAEGDVTHVRGVQGDARGYTVHEPPFAARVQVDDESIWVLAVYRTR